MYVRCGALLMPSVFYFFTRLVETPFCFFWIFCFFLPSLPGLPSYRVLNPSHRTIVSCHIGTWGRRSPLGGTREFVPWRHERRWPVKSCVLYIWVVYSHLSMWLAGSGSSGTLGGLHVRRISYHQECVLTRPAGRHSCMRGVWPCRLAGCCLSIIPSFLSPSHRLARSGPISRKLEPGRLGVAIPCVRFQLTNTLPLPINFTPPAGRLVRAVGWACSS